ncbi:4Fe-4S binding domain-containing protein [Saccharicrinis carchari]|uniref:4Fe-4S binding domain-containing protein n=1 Tax=Saccharicrinis carchari TaxID=1168039 RepID=A0A521BF21_SACCC|nr:EFR1 family ferrodoxin [Saccharicrinis carchari]SMO45684.1 4Fe-4S binding domain-containing protein [Saccharicrinis carchari]
METSLSKVNLIYFSATGNTKKIVKAIGRNLEWKRTVEHNLADEESDLFQHKIERDSLSIIGVPVYRGRVPLLVAEKLQKLQSDGSLAVPVVVYGNRHFDDALLELNDMVTGCGFKVMAAAAFIGEHSYSSEENPIAHQRPDKEDMEQCRSFAREIKIKIQESTSYKMLHRSRLPGNYPFKEHPAIPLLSPETLVDDCILCGICGEVCPADAITVSAEVLTKKEECIWCCACVKRCPTQARVFKNEWIDNFVEMLTTHCQARKEPACFF